MIHNDQNIFIAKKDNMEIWNIENQEIEEIIQDNFNDPVKLLISENGQILVSGHFDSTFKIFNTTSFK